MVRLQYRGRSESATTAVARRSHLDYVTRSLDAARRRAQSPIFRTKTPVTFETDFLTTRVGFLGTFQVVTQSQFCDQAQGLRSNRLPSW